jgi:prepilin peptidase CpaA
VVTVISAPLIIVLLGALIAAVTDVWKFRVYNALTIPLLVSGLAYHVWGGDIGDSVLGMLLGFSVLIVLHIVGGVGAGDVKLMAAVGAWLGTQHTLYVFIASSLAAGLYALLLVAINGGLARALVNLQILIYRLMNIGRYLGADDRMEADLSRADRRTRVIPFGAMVAVGLVATLVYLGVK